VLLEVEERVDAESQIALDRIPDITSVIYLALPFCVSAVPNAYGARSL
jgi:hypothetical protein